MDEEGRHSQMPRMMLRSCSLTSRKNIWYSEKEKAEKIRNHIKRAKVLIERIDSSSQIDDATKAEILHLNSLDSLCDKHELDWPIKGLRLNFLKLFRLLLW